MHKPKLQLLSFYLHHHLFAIPVTHVSKVIRAVAVTPIPDISEACYGVLDFHGEVLPVVNLRHRFSMPAKPIGVNDRFLIIQTEKRSFAIVADEIEEIRMIEESDLQELNLTDISEKKAKSTGLKQYTFYRNEGAIIIICDIEELLNSELIIQIDKLKESMKEAVSA